MKEATKNTLFAVGGFAAIMIVLLAVQVLFQDYVGSMLWAYCTVFFMIFAMIEGFVEATTDHFKIKANEVYNGHLMYRIKTTLMLLSIYTQTNWQTVGCLILTYMFLHDGMYHWKRNDLDNKVYPKKWFDFTKTPIAFSDKLGIGKPIIRTTLFVIGVIGLIIFNYVTK